LDKISIRAAGVKDAPAIAALKGQVWPDEESDAVQVARALSHPAHHASVALAGEEVIGFVDGFTTLSGEGVLRWEVDLLGVHPSMRCFGVGEKLARENLAHGRGQRAAHARALIHVENQASCRVFHRCGFEPIGGVDVLLISRNPPSGEMKGKPGAHFVPVVTFNYSGAWLEPPFDEGVFLHARSVQHSAGWKIMGAVIPNEDLCLVNAAAAAGYIHAGRYRWWGLEL